MRQPLAKRSMVQAVSGVSESSEEQSFRGRKLATLSNRKPLQKTTSSPPMVVLRQFFRPFKFSPKANVKGTSFSPIPLIQSMRLRVVLRVLSRSIAQQ